MRRRAIPFVPVIDRYKSWLQKEVRRGEMAEVTMTTRLNHANRVFETCLCVMSAETLEALTAQWFGPRFPGLDKRGRRIVIRDLRKLIGV